MNKLYALCVSCLACITTNVMANEQLLHQHVDHLLVYGTTAIVKISGTGTNAENCTSSQSNKWLLLDLTNGKEQYSAVLAAYLANREVSFGVSGCQAWGQDTIPKVYRVEVHKI